METTEKKESKLIHEIKKHCRYSDGGREILENIINLSYRMAKGISFFLLVVSFLVFVSSALFLVLSYGDEFLTPEFNEVLESNLEVNKNNDYSETEKRREIEKEFGDQILKIVKKNNLPDRKYDNIIRGLAKLGANYQSDFIDGLEVFLDDASDYKTNKNVNYNAGKVMNKYIGAFENAMNREVHLKLENKETRLKLLGVMGVTLLMFIMIMIIPLLLKIEENTRQKG